ncbi:aldo/keto reductase [Bizionia sp.]|uniref:aldo/keto reductase n=1 Tax=Bizionia sp. TaxID=1954480 RepID=UPI003A8E2F3E
MDLTTKIGLGTVQFGVDYGISNQSGMTSKLEVKYILDTAYNLSINTIDTAMAYGNAEEVIGNYELNRFKVVSKFMPSEEYGSVYFQLIESLKKLQIYKLYGYLAHRPMYLINNPKDWKELIKLKDENKVEKIGFSLNTVEELELLIKKDFIPDIIQVPYNYFDTRFEKSMILLKQKGCEIHTRSTFLQGLFFMNPTHLGDFFNDIKPLLNKLQNENKFLAGALLNYVLNKDFIDKVIVGVENTNQLKQNISDIEKAEELEELKINVNNEILSPFLWRK